MLIQEHVSRLERVELLCFVLINITRLHMIYPITAIFQANLIIRLQKPDIESS